MLTILLTFLLAAPVRADEPLSAPERKAAAEARAAADAAKDAVPDPSSEPACPADPAESVAKLKAAPDREAYDCLIGTDGADATIMAVLAEMPPVLPDDPAADGERNRLTRALALYVVARLDQGITDEQSRALLPADRRLVRDAVHARRGRKSPSEEHEVVFTKLGWYHPDPKYTNTRLTELDKQVIDKLDHPPEPPKSPEDETAAEAMDAAAAQSAEARRGLCSCAAAPGAPVLPLLLPLLVVARRRR